MRHIESRRSIYDQIEKQFPTEHLHYKYACDFTESKNNCDISIAINPQPSPIAITNHLDEDYLPIGIYHLNRVYCSCPSPLKRVSQQIQSLFRKKITKQNCRVHTKEFDVYLRSNQPLSFRKM